MRAFDKITLLGGGAFGVALAKIASEQAQEVVLWARDQQVCEHINKFHTHPTKLSSIKLSSRIYAMSNLKNALSNADIVILTLPMDALKPVLEQTVNYIQDSCVIISTTKGVNRQSLELPCDIINNIFRKPIAEQACYLSGPSFAEELALGLPTALTIASKNRLSAMRFQHGFSQKNLRLYYSEDVIGVCVGGALKNVIAIAAGICTGLQLGRNALASLITRGLAEMSRLTQSLGGQAHTLSGLSGVGDLVLSCTDSMSRNHRLGLLLAQKYSIPQALRHIGSVVEGAKTVQAVIALAQKHKVDMPISLAVYEVLYNNMALDKAMSELLNRVLKDEF